jgi:hypothetical protein
MGNFDLIRFQLGRGVAKIEVRRLAVRQARVRFPARHPYYMEIPLLSNSSEDIGVGLDD